MEYNVPSVQGANAIGFLYGKESVYVPYPFTLPEAPPTKPISPEMVAEGYTFNIFVLDQRGFLERLFLRPQKRLFVAWIKPPTVIPFVHGYISTYEGREKSGWTYPKALTTSDFLR